MAETGTVAWFSARRGFGFIATDRVGSDVLVREAQVSAGITSLNAGARVAFDTRTGETDQEAINLVVLSSAARHR